VRIALLGPLEVHDGTGAPVDLSGERLRALLARLALDPGRPVSAEGLMAAVWRDAPPAGVSSALQSLVFRLRRALPPTEAALVESLPTGYRLAVAPDAVDVGRFEQLVARGRAAGDSPAAVRCYTDALALWRGDPLADVGGADFAVAVAARLTELRLRAVEDRAELQLATGGAAERIAELTELAAAHPLRERLCAVRMRVLHAAGRPAEALAAFAGLRRSLAEALGADPSPALRDLHGRVLRGETVDAPARRARGRTARTPITSFVGREEELARVGELRSHARLLTIVGPGGVGKSRLVAEVAAQAESAGETVRIVELADVRDPADVPAAVLAALGSRETRLLDTGARSFDGATRDSLSQRVRDALGDHRGTVVLDNCEHLIDAVAHVADAITSGSADVRVITTSREPLAITGEVLCPIGPLRTAPSDVDIGEAADYSALRLFADRASAVRPGFALTADNLPAVAEVCHRLDGLPLAIELACARLRTIPVEEIAARIGNRFRLLTGGSRTALPRHRTLQAVVEWSWELFTPAERALARRLAVFAGGASPTAAEAVCADAEIAPEDVLGLLGGLVDKSFVELVEVPGAPPRYRMLDTIGAYAAAALAEAGEADEVRRAHAAHFLSLAEEAEPGLRTAEQIRVLAWTEREYDNLTSALRWAVDSADATTAVRLSVALGWYWMLRSSHGEAAAWFREVLALPGVAAGAGPGVLAAAHAYDAVYHFAIDDRGHAERAAAASHAFAGRGAAAHPALTLVSAMTGQRDAAPGAGSDPWVRAADELFRGLAAESAGELAAAGAHFAEARARFTACGDRWGAAAAVNALRAGQSLAGDHAAAIAALGEAIALAEEIGAVDDAAVMRVDRGLERLRAGDLAGASADLTAVREEGAARRSPLVLALAETGQGELARHAGNPDEAVALLSSALRRLTAVDGLPTRFRALTTVGLGRLCLAVGDLDGAAARLDDALELGLAGADRPVIAAVAEAVADLRLATGDPRGAAGLLGLAAAARGVPDRGSPDVRRTERALRDALGEDFAAALASPAGLGSTAAARAAVALVGDGRPPGQGLRR
jgi:predicted ATPase/DNA-binding SARP family transcriptional activator